MQSIKLLNFIRKPYGALVGQLSTSFNQMVKRLRETIVSRDELVKEISNRKLLEEELREREERYRLLFNNVSDAVFVHEVSAEAYMPGRIIEVNDIACRYLGYTREELLQMSVAEIETPEYAPLAADRIKELQRRGDMIFETVHMHRNGALIPVEVSSRLINCDGTSAMLSIARDITNRKIFEQMIENLRRQNELILNSVWEGILGLDSEGRHTFINPSAARMLGYEVEELIGKQSHPIWHHTKEDGSVYPGEECPIFRTSRNPDEYYVREDIFWRKDGTSFPVSYTSSSIMENNNIVGAVVTFRDITERKQAEEKIKSSLREKELLLREIHHRVKNNLQILTSLISFQIKEDNEPRINQILSECNDRIKTIAIIHEKLYQTKHFSSIEVRKLISDIAGSLVYSLRDTGNRTGLILNIQDITIGIDVAIPLGLIVNEIVSNSVKHAFPSEMNGEISIDFYAMNGEFVLSIHDTGVGFPDDFEIEKSDSLGMYLIYTLTEQLNGIADFIRDNGTTVKIHFKKQT